MTFQTKQFPRLRNLSHPLPNSSSIRRKGKLVRNESGNTPNELSQGAKKAARKLPPIPPPPPPPPLSRACTTRIYIHVHIQHIYVQVYIRDRDASPRNVSSHEGTKTTRPALPSPLSLPPARTFTTVDRPPRLPPSTLAIEQKKEKKPRVPSVSESGRIRSIIPERRRRRRGGASFTLPPWPLTETSHGVYVCPVFRRDDHNATDGLTFGPVLVHLIHTSRLVPPCTTTGSIYASLSTQEIRACISRTTFHAHPYKVYTDCACTEHRLHTAAAAACCCLLPLVKST